MRVENQSAGSSELCTAGSLEFFNPPDPVGLKRAKPLLQIHPGISFMENKRTLEIKTCFVPNLELKWQQGQHQNKNSRGIYGITDGITYTCLKRVKPADISKWDFYSTQPQRHHKVIRQRESSLCVLSHPGYNLAWMRQTLVCERDDSTNVGLTAGKIKVSWTRVGISIYARQ
ncbi:hypothetical protein Q9966_012857 [Columba livia]|nr:hypothetical protein Q9966_012857 [Columba livia]